MQLSRHQPGIQQPSSLAAGERPRERTIPLQCAAPRPRQTRETLRGGCTENALLYLSNKHLWRHAIQCAAQSSPLSRSDRECLLNCYALPPICTAMHARERLAECGAAGSLAPFSPVQVSYQWGLDCPYDIGHFDILYCITRTWSSSLSCGPGTSPLAEDFRSLGDFGRLELQSAGTQESLDEVQ
jgi:hypothetical protein